MLRIFFEPMRETKEVDVFSLIFDDDTLRLGYGLKGNHVGGNILQIGSTRRERYLDLRRGFAGRDGYHAVVRNGAEFLGEYDVLSSVVEVVLIDMAFVEDEASPWSQP